jgi:hypothetical protein
MTVSISGENIELKGGDAISLVQPHLFQVAPELRELLNEQADLFLLKNKKRIRRSLSTIGLNGYAKMTRPLTIARHRAKKLDARNQETIARFQLEPPEIQPEDRALLYQRLYGFSERISKNVFKVSVPMGYAGLLLNYFEEQAERSLETLPGHVERTQWLTKNALEQEDIMRLVRAHTLKEGALPYLAYPILADEIGYHETAISLAIGQADRYQGYVAELRPIAEPIGHA